MSENALKKHLTKLKKRVPYGYLREMGSQALQDVVERLYRSYKRFFHERNGAPAREAPCIENMH